MHLICCALAWLWVKLVTLLHLQVIANNIMITERTQCWYCFLKWQEKVVCNQNFTQSVQMSDYCYYIIVIIAEINIEWWCEEMLSVQSIMLSVAVLLIYCCEIKLWNCSVCISYTSYSQSLSGCFCWRWLSTCTFINHLPGNGFVCHKCSVHTNVNISINTERVQNDGFVWSIVALIMSYHHFWHWHAAIDLQEQY